MKFKLPPLTMSPPALKKMFMGLTSNHNHITLITSLLYYTVIFYSFYNSTSKHMTQSQHVLGIGLQYSVPVPSYAPPPTITFFFSLEQWICMYDSVSVSNPFRSGWFALGQGSDPRTAPGGICLSLRCVGLYEYLKVAYTHTQHTQASKQGHG